MGWIGQIVTAALLGIWIPVVMSGFMLLSDAPNANPGWKSLLPVMAVNFYPALIGVLYYVKGWRFILLPPVLFLALTIVFPAAACLFLYRGLMMELLRGR